MQKAETKSEVLFVRVKPSTKRAFIQTAAQNDERASDVLHRAILRYIARNKKGKK